MGTLLYFAVFAGLFFLMMRFGCGSHVTGHGHGGHEKQEGHEVHGAGAPQAGDRPEAAPLLGAPAGADWHPRRYGEETAGAIDTAVRELIDAAFKRAVEILAANRELLDQAAKELLAKETFSAEDLREIAAKLPPASAEKTPKVGVSVAAASPAPLWKL